MKQKATIKPPQRANISHITLRSGKEYQAPLREVDDEAPNLGNEEGDNLTQKNGRAVTGDVVQLDDLRKPLPRMADPFFLESEHEVEKAGSRKEVGESSKETTNNTVKLTKPFPYRGEAKKKKEDPVDFIEMFSQLEIKLPLLQALKLPPFSRFIKDYMAGKTRADGKIVIEENVSR